MNILLVLRLLFSKVESVPIIMARYPVLQNSPMCLCDLETGISQKTTSTAGDEIGTLFEAIKVALHKCVLKI